MHEMTVAFEGRIRRRMAVGAAAVALAVMPAVAHAGPKLTTAEVSMLRDMAEGDIGYKTYIASASTPSLHAAPNYYQLGINDDEMGVHFHYISFELLSEKLGMLIYRDDSVPLRYEFMINGDFEYQSGYKYTFKFSPAVDLSPDLGKQALATEISWWHQALKPIMPVIRARIAKGETPDAIGKTYGVTGDKISRWLKEMPQ